MPHKLSSNSIVYQVCTLDSESSDSNSSFPMLFMIILGFSSIFGIWPLKTWKINCCSYSSDLICLSKFTWTIGKQNYENFEEKFRKNRNLWSLKEFMTCTQNNHLFLEQWKKNRLRTSLLIARVFIFASNSIFNSCGAKFISPNSWEQCKWRRLHTFVDIYTAYTCIVHFFSFF